MSSDTYHVSHNIASFSSANLQADSSAIVERNIFNFNRGQDLLEIFLDVTAPDGEAAADATPELQLYIEETEEEFSKGLTNAFCEGISITSPITIAAGTRRRFKLQTLDIGPHRCALAITGGCPDGTAIKVLGRRRSGTLITQ